MSVRRLVITAAAATAVLAVASPLLAQQKAPAGAERSASQGLRPDQADLLLAMLRGAPAEGFSLDAFPTDGLEAARDGDAGAQAKLRQTAVAYAKAQHGLRISKDDFDKNWGLRPAAYDAAKELNFALSQDRLKEWIDSQAPPFQRYRQLRDGLAVYTRIAQKPWKAVPAGADLGMGATGARVRALRERLVFEDGALGQIPLDTAFDARLQDSVKRFQERHGLNPTGLVSKGTVAALNVTPAQRATQIRANMERWRWAPRDLAPTRLEVNIPQAVLQAFDDTRPTMRMLAVSGKPGDETPMLHSTITSIVLNPAWHVPASIAPELMAKQRKNKGYFKSEGISTQPGNKIAPLIQAPGPKNALGQIKFDFQNTYGVYLHDTPGQTAFDRSRRDVSHGCVRLEKPLDLAAKVLGPNGDWPAQKIDTAVKSTDTQRVALKQSQPVYLFYFTAFDDGRQLSFSPDVYGWDAKLLRLLDAGASSNG